jgi:hypothetical protein
LELAIGHLSGAMGSGPRVEVLLTTPIRLVR